MMSDMLPKKEICVLTVGMDSRKQAIFRMAFKMHTMQTYLLAEDVPDRKPDVAIVDMDCVDGQQIWAHHCANNAGVPTLIVTVSDMPGATVPVLIKPVRMETLFPLLRQIMSERRVPPAIQPDHAPAQRTAVHPGPRVESAAEQPAARTEAPVAQPAAPLQRMPDQVGRFDPCQGLLGVLQEVLKSRRPSMVAIAEQNSLIVFPEQERVLVLQNMDHVRKACDEGNISISSRPLLREDKPDDRNVVMSNFISLLWQVALWTSRGRLPEGIPVNAPVKLRYWPNLTRMAPVPNSLRIAAFLVRSPASLPIAVRMLNVPPGDLFDFLSASYIIGLLEVSETANNVSAEREVPPPEAKAATGKGAILSRLLRRIIGL